MSVDIRVGDCLDTMRAMADNSVDAIVTDPPYGLTFMGAGWDRDVPSSLVWAEALRVLKPGGHLLAFAGTRTQHRMASRVEDAGFEIRDIIAWVYGQGFPKSHDVSKAIDKAAGAERDKTPTVPMQIGSAVGAISKNVRCAICGKARASGNPCTCPRLEDVPATDAARQWDGWGTSLKPCLEPVTVARKPLVGTVAANVLKYGTGAININACRVVSSTGQRPNEETPWDDVPSLCASCAATAEPSAKPTAPASRASTATKPAGASLSGKGATSPADTDRANTGCSDGMRAESSAISSSIGASGKMPTAPSLTDTRSTTSTATRATTASATCNVCGASITPSDIASTTAARKNSPRDANSNAPAAPAGRWPGNLIHDGSEEVVRLFPQTTSGSRSGTYSAKGNVYGEYGDKTAPLAGSSGSAARFFYAAKASKAERGEGNTHPTVKPLALMRYLVRLVTPPGGLVLDPFAGSGTTGLAAQAEGMRAVLCELSPEYADIIRARLANAAPLFAEAAE